MPVRKINAGYSNLTAKVPSAKLNRMADAESSLERDFVLLLDNDESICRFEEQPLTIEFFLPDGSKRSYTPDVLADYKSGQRVLFEVKYREELKKKWTVFKPKFKAAISFCKNNDMHFKIITENEIRTPKLKNVEFLSHFSRTVSGSEDAIRQALIQSLLALGDANPKEVLASCFSCKMKRAEAAPVLWRLIFDGAIKANLEFPLTMLTNLTLSDDILESL